MSKYLLGGAMAAAMVAIAPAVAQTAPAPTAAPMAAHAGHDMAKTHTRAEVAAKVRSHFERLDTNKDGFLTKAEADSGRGMMRDRMKAMTPADHNAMFDRIDANKDGQISRAEFAAAHQGKMAMHGMPGKHGMHGKHGKSMDMGGLRGRMFDMADANRDGRVTLQEATAAAYRHFDMADVNRDGQVTREERMQMHQKMRAGRHPG